jgi:hypothetical protein
MAFPPQSEFLGSELKGSLGSGHLASASRVSADSDVV